MSQQKQTSKHANELKSQLSKLSGYHSVSVDSPPFSFRAKAPVDPQKAKEKTSGSISPREAVSDQRSSDQRAFKGNQSAARFANISNAEKEKFVPRPRKETESFQSIKIMRQQEVLLCINQKVRQLNSEFERTLRFCEELQIKHKQEMQEKNVIIMMQNNKITHLCQQVDSLRCALKLS